MKRTALERKTPLKAKAPMARRAFTPKRRVKKTGPKSEQRFRCPAYLAFVRSLPCCACGGRATDAHHVIGLHWGLSGMGTTAPDSFAMPACRECHRDIHTRPGMQARQPWWLTDTINRGLDHFTDEPIVGALADALEFIAARENAHG